MATTRGGSGAARGARLPFGVAVGPFLGVAVFVLLIAAGTRHDITTSWVLTAVVLGVVAAGVAVGVSVIRPPVRRFQAQATKPAPAHESSMDTVSVSGARDEAPVFAGERPGADPLANIHAVEVQGRRHRRKCVNCGTPVPVRQAECPGCGQPQVYSCKGCQTPIRLEWTNCPECGRSLA